MRRFRVQTGSLCEPMADRRSAACAADECRRMGQGNDINRWQRLYRWWLPVWVELHLARPPLASGRRRWSSGVGAVELRQESPLLLYVRVGARGRHVAVWRS